MWASRAEAEAEASKNFNHVFTWTDGPYVHDNLMATHRLTSSRNAHYPPHKHSGLTTHLILRGQLTISYPDDKSPKKETFGPGAVVDVDGGRRHEVWMGSEGCTYVIGE